MVLPNNEREVERMWLYELIIELVESFNDSRLGLGCIDEMIEFGEEG